MGYLVGFQEYLEANYHASVFDEALASGQSMQFHVHGHGLIQGEVIENLVFDIGVRLPDKEILQVPKIEIKLLYPLEAADAVSPLLGKDKKTESLGLAPISSPAKRHHIKNKTLFPLMKERCVLFFTLLEGEIVRGIMTDFSRYEIAVSLKGGMPVTILRHSIYDIRDKKGRCFLKSFQEKQKDWEKSPLFVPGPPEA